MERPKDSDASRCIGLRKQSKRGIRLHSDDLAFCEQMFRAYPDWYINTEERVFNETVPFGSITHYKKRSKDK